jgi:hypothetical protein
MTHESLDPRAEERDVPDGDEPGCRAGQYSSVPDSYNGRALCGCLDCIEYVANRESEDQV